MWYRIPPLQNSSILLLLLFLVVKIGSGLVGTTLQFDIQLIMKWNSVIFYGSYHIKLVRKVSL